MEINMQFNPAISTRGSFFILASPSHAPRISMRSRIYSLLPHFVLVVAAGAVEDHDGSGHLGHGRITAYGIAITSSTSSTTTKSSPSAAAARAASGASSDRVCQNTPASTLTASKTSVCSAHLFNDSKQGDGQNACAVRACSVGRDELQEDVGKRPCVVRQEQLSAKRSHV